MTDTNSTKKCFQCGSSLMLIRQETIQPEGALYPQTNSVYRCSNEKCQNEQDKQQAQRVEQRKKKLLAEQERAEKIQEKRKILQKGVNING